MKKQSMAKKVLSAITAIIMVVSMLVYLPDQTLIRNADAATVEQANQNDVFLKQQGEYTCTLCASAMLMRRVALYRGDSDWYSITESSLMPYAWFSEGLYNSFSYKGINVTCTYVSRGDTDTLISMLNQHPEGIVVYNYDYPHAILLTDYTNGTFYCADPANGVRSGRIPVSEALISIYKIDKVWYCSSPAVKPSPSTVKVSFDYSGGVGSDSYKIVNCGSTYGTLPSSSKVGYSFEGWFKSDGTQIKSDTQVVSNEDHTLTAHWKGNNYKVKFDPNGGTCSELSKTVTYNEKYGILPVPIKTDYTFTGWYSSINDGEHYNANSDYVLLKDQTLYAHWKHEVIASGTCGKNAKWEYDKSGTLTITGTGAMDNYTTAGAPWYDYIGGIKKVVIEEGITSIGMCAFDGCEYLTTVNLSDSVTSIGSIAFQNCRMIKNIDLPDNLTSISHSTFASCSNLSEIDLPLTLKYIGAGAFSGCAIEELSIPQSITSIGAQTFSGCTHLKNIDLPDTLTSIDYSAFINCYQLEITIPKNVKTISNMALSECKSINVSNDNPYFSSQDGVLFNKDKTTLICFPVGCTMEEYTIPDTVKTIGGAAFYMCRLKDIVISNSVEEIEAAAFYHCSELTNINIPNKVTVIRDSTFIGCSNLKSLIIPKSVESIEENAFYSCENLEDIYILNKNCSIANNLSTIAIGKLYTTITGAYNYDGTIHGYINSTAHSYANKYKRNFAPLDLLLDENKKALRNGEQYTILANQENLIYKSNNNDVAVVSKNGLVTAVGEGEAIISVINADSEVVQFMLTVVPANGIDGDVNMDNTLSISDLVMLQRFILGDGSLINWKGADLCKDNIIDSFDLVLMRQLLISMG